jgi:predicted HTH domain antitoxin
MSNITIELPESILIPTGQSREGFIREAKFLLASKLYELGRVSSGRAASLCEMDRVTFLLSLHRVGVAAIDLDERELADDIQYARGE